MKTIAITGASGFVGQNLIKFFTSKNQKVVPIKREYLKDDKKLLEIVSTSDIIINLAGANIINRWTESYKELLYSSRIDTTKALVKAINNSDTKPQLLISTSAIGVYDNKNTYDETAPINDDFLGNLGKDWEAEAKKAQIPVSIFRFGIVLGKNGGALDKMLLPFKLGVGGVIGSGNQAFSFIHMEDLLKAYEYVIEHNLDGIFNLVSPTPTTNKGLTKALGKYLHRPTVLPVPEFMLKLIFSEGAKILTDGQSVVPQNLLTSGFKFKYNNIDEAIEELVK